MKSEVRSEEFRKKLFACGSEVSSTVAAAGRDMDGDADGVPFHITIIHFTLNSSL